jgi:hypothetical protein
MNAGQIRENECWSNESGYCPNETIERWLSEDIMNILDQKGNANHNDRDSTLPLSEQCSSVTQTTNASKDVGKRNPSTRWWGCKLVQPLRKAVWRSLKKLRMELPYDPAIPLLGLYPKECALGHNRATCTPTFIAALFTISQVWKQPRCPTIDEWSKKMWHIHTMEFYLVIKRSEIMLFAGKWMELENFTLSEVSQAHKIEGCLFSLICES